MASKQDTNTPSEPSSLRVDKPRRFSTVAIKAFFSTGTVFRSSAASGRRIARTIDSNARIIVEYGAGDGAVTKAMLRSMPSDSKLYAIEILEDFYAALKEIKDPKLFPVLGSVVDLSSRLIELTGGRPDIIVSGIPFSFLSLHDQVAIVANSFASLRPGGKLVVYQVTPQLIPLLRKYFHKVKLQIELFNMPPYFIMTATKASDRVD